MKILLIQPPQENTLTFVTPNIKSNDIGVFPPLGLLYLASYIKKHSDYNVAILDSLIDKLSYTDIEEKIKAFNPDIIGVTALTFTMPDVMKTIRLAKKVIPSALICLGGAHVSLYPKETLSLPGVDYVFIGDSEKSFKKFIDNIEQGKDLEEVEGLGYKKEGRIHIKPCVSDNENLDMLPFPDRTLIPYKKYWNMLSKKNISTSMVTSRGCLFKCTFCSEHLNKYRKRSPENVVKEIEECVALGIKAFCIFDDTFTADRKRVFEICKLIIEKKIDIALDIRTRVDVVDPEMIRMLKKVGCETIRYGVESGSQEILKSMKKGINLKHIVDVFRFTKKMGITSFGYFMLGFPGETQVHINRTIKFARELNPDYVQFSITTPLPETEIYKLGLKKGLYLNDYWREYALNPEKNFIPPVWEELLSKEELIKSMNRAYRNFYLRISLIMRQIKNLKSINEFKRKVTAFLNTFLLK